LHRSAAVFTGRNGALEITVIERMILYFNGQPFVGRIVGRPSSDRPRLEDSVEFEPQVVVQAARGMFLDDEAQPA
jgi:hypothetical protein